MSDALEIDGLRDDFRRAVDTASAKPAARLRVSDADGSTGPLPGRAGTGTGQRVPAVLRGRRTGLAEDDLRATEEVVETVTARTAPENEPAAGDTPRRHRPMTPGHDPLEA
ncbi:DUF3140 domain-containing protein [Streptomyces sp. NPDC016626]|uniref:DUF3140 domain-containing protein n=1 Tax=Streptomyces sp. NPDC016626 TaxID=3364968 RepID=UPI0036F6D1FA